MNNNNNHIISNLFHDSNSRYKYLLIQLLGKFTNSFSKEVITEMYHLIKNREEDYKIITFLMIHGKKMEQMDSVKRAIKSANIWKSFINESKEKIIVNKYLDVGCNNGVITVEFGKKLGLDASDIYGIDINKFTEQTIIPVDGFIFKEYDGYHIPYNDDFFDLVSCSMVFHHVKYVSVLLADIRRVIKDRGFLFVKEHNCNSKQMEQLIFLEHLFYDVMDYGVEYEYFKNNYFQRLFSRDNFIELMLSFGFELVLVPDKEFVSKFQKYNPTQSYYALFKKVPI